MNKRGIVKTIEASVAIFLVAGVLFYLVNQQTDVASLNYDEFARDIVEEIARNASMRAEILGSSDLQCEGGGAGVIPESVQEFIEARVPSNLAWEARVCEVENVCGKCIAVDGEVYAGERVISSTIDISPESSKKIRLFIWS